MVKPVYVQMTAVNTQCDPSLISYMVSAFFFSLIYLPILPESCTHYCFMIKLNTCYYSIKMTTSPLESPYHIHSNHSPCDHMSCISLNRKHMKNTYKKPISKRSHDVFQYLIDHQRQNPMPLIVDSGCGKGTSSRRLATQYPNHRIIAADQSQHRLAHLRKNTPNNVLILCIDCVDLWTLLHRHIMPITMHSVFYPNPWPKKQHEKRRWYAHPIAPTFFNLSPITLIRSNWLYYLESSQTVACQYGLHTHLSQIAPSSVGISHFETKYINAHVPIYQLAILRPHRPITNI